MPAIILAGSMQFWEKGQLTRDLNRAKQEIANIEKSCQYYKRRCEILGMIIQDLDPNLLPPRGKSQQEDFLQRIYPEKAVGLVTSGPDTFLDFLLSEMQNNSCKSPQGRRWSPTTAMFCFACMSLGPKSYQFARAFLSLPSRETLFRIFSEPQACWREAVLDLTKLATICSLFRRRHGIFDGLTVDVGIGVDAMSMEPTKCTDGSECFHNHVFAFMLLPLSTAYKPMTLHLLTAQSGNANQTVHSILAELKWRLAALNFKVRFIATDGDSGYSVLHQNMLPMSYGEFTSKGLESALTLLKEANDVVVSDLLHLFKNARARIINGRVTMNLNGLLPFTASDMNRVLELGNALTDTTSKGKMLDQYPLEIFTINNFLRLVMKGQVNMAFFILPYSIWNIALRSPNLSVQMRMDLLSIVMDIFMFYEECLKNVDPTKVSERKHAEIPQYFCSTQHCHRVLNTLVATLVEMKRSPTNLALDRIGTHVLECQFGLIRMMCHYKHDWKRILRAFSNSLLVTDIASILGHNIPIRTRLNCAGVRITENSFGGVYISTESMNSRELYESVNVFISQQSGSPDFGYDIAVQMIPELANFVSFVSNLSVEIEKCGVTTSKIWSGGPISHGTIIARLISFCRGPQRGEEDAEDLQSTEDTTEDSQPGESVESWDIDTLFIERESPK